MGQQGLAAPTIRAYLSGVRQLQIARGFPDPEIGNMPRLKQVLRGVAVTKGMEGRSPARSRLPITPNILRRMKAVWSKRPPKELHESLMLWAAACVTFFTFSRSGEMTVPDGSAFDSKLHLTISDVAIDKEEAPKVIAIRLRRSKTDQVGRGTSLVMGRTGIELCPVEALFTLHWPQGHSTRAFIPVEGRLSADAFAICNGGKEGPDCCRTPSPELRRPQLPNWGGYDSCHARVGGLHHPDLGKVEEPRFPLLHQARDRTAGIPDQDTSPRRPVTRTKEYNHSS